MIALIQSYFFWHYTHALQELLQNIKNFLKFLYHFFSIGILFKTFFAPWRSLGEPYPRGFKPVESISILLNNLSLRMIGIALRTTVILIGLLALFLSAVVSVAFFIIWLIAPALILFMLSAGGRLIFY